MAGEKAQKRGGGSLGGGSGVNKFYGNSDTAGHIMDESYDSEEEIADWLKSTYQMNDDEAYSMAEALDDFTGSNYFGIRKALYEGKTNTDSYKEGQELEKFIAMSPKYYGQGPLYRGIKVSDAEAQNIVNVLSNGGTIDMRGPASWSSRRTVAEGFSGSFSQTSIIFHLPEGTKAGASVRHVSNYHGEDEVLTSMKTRYSSSKIVFNSEMNRYEIDLIETVVS